MTTQTFKRKSCTVCGCHASPRSSFVVGESMSDLATSELPDDSYRIKCCDDDMCFVFDKDLTPDELVKLTDAVTAWKPPEYCLVFHFPP